MIIKQDPKSRVHVSKDWNADRSLSWWRLQTDPWNNHDVGKRDSIMLTDVSFVRYTDLLAARIDRNSGLPYLFAVGTEVDPADYAAHIGLEEESGKSLRALALGVGFRPKWPEAPRARFYLDTVEGERIDRADLFLADEDGKGWVWA